VQKGQWEMTTSTALRILALAWASLFVVVPSRAGQGSTITPELICLVKDAIRWRDPTWRTSTCTTVAKAISSASEPTVTLAIAILESDLREKETSAVVRYAGARAVDVGLMGVRCILQGAGNRCTSGPARGLTVHELQDPATNIAIGSAILDEKRRIYGSGYLSAYNGDRDGSNGYAGNVAAIVAALGGVRIEAKGKRVRKLVEQIASAVNNERRS
jgi:hypothetical protein